jgi:hypothetical protein
MKRWATVAIITVVLGTIAFLLDPMSPFGGFWPPSPEIASPTGIQVPLLMFLAIVEALTFGLGVSFLVFGYPYVHALAPASRRLSFAAYIAIGWLLITWWPHDSLHIHTGMDLNGLIRIDYMFHFTLIIAGLTIAWFFLTVMGAQRKGQGTPVTHG